MSVKERDVGYDFIRFFAMFLILIQHFFSSCDSVGFKYSLFLKNIIEHGSVKFGGVGVALFFMLSGAVLSLSSKNNISIKEFYKKRLLRIEIPQILGFAFAFGVIFITTNRDIIHNDILGIIISALGLTYTGLPWLDYFHINTFWVVGEWFTAVIILLYVLFPLLKYLFDKFCLISTIVITIIFVLNLKFKILSAANGWFSITNGLMYFWLGCLFNEYKKYLREYIHIYIVLATIIWFANPLGILGHNYLPCFLFSILLFLILYDVKISNRFTNFICKYCYEIYLTHHRVYDLLLPVFLCAWGSVLQLGLAFIFLLAIIFVVSMLLHKMSNFIIKKI